MKLLIGGSPCTHWSIAQTKNRETEPSGIGWELFLNFLFALEKYKPDYFLYENNKSMSKAIREEITRCFGFEPVMINSAKLSAQNRERLYWLGKREPDGTYSRVVVEQPEDRGILLRDILESGVVFREKGYTLKANYKKVAASNLVHGGHFPAPGAAEPVNIMAEDMIARRQIHRVGDMPTEDGKITGSQSKRIYSANGKAPSLSASISGGNSDFSAPATGLYAEPIRIGTIESEVKNQDADSQQYRVYSPDGKSVTLCGQGGGLGAKTGLYAVPVQDGRTDGIHPVGELEKLPSEDIQKLDQGTALTSPCQTAGQGGDAV